MGAPIQAAQYIAEVSAYRPRIDAALRRANLRPFSSGMALGYRSGEPTFMCCKGIDHAFE